SGLGEGIARALAAEGVNVMLFARSGDKLAAVARSIEADHGVRATTVIGDMSKKEDVEKLKTAAKDQEGGLDILILNTGRPPAPMRFVLDEDNDDRWEEAYQTQLWGGIQVARALVPLILSNGWGRVVGISSATIKQPMFRHGLSTVYRAGMQG